MAGHLEFGKERERSAEDFLLSSGDRVLLARNYRLRTGEIDLILEEIKQTQSGPILELVFVEVRARVQGALQSSVESVGWKKRQKLCRTIRKYLAEYRGGAKTLRVDLMAWDGKEWEHLRDVWLLD